MEAIEPNLLYAVIDQLGFENTGLKHENIDLKSENVRLIRAEAAALARLKEIEVKASSLEQRYAAMLIRLNDSEMKVDRAEAKTAMRRETRAMEERLESVKAEIDSQREADKPRGEREAVSGGSSLRKGASGRSPLSQLVTGEAGH